jgi:hypothetical protein
MCGGFKHSDDGYRVAYEPGKSKWSDAFEYCEACEVDVLEAVHNGKLELAVIDGKDMKDHFIDEDLEIRKIPQPKD